MLLQATLNGAFTKRDHHAVPISCEELTRDAVASVAAGARAIHLHPRDSEGHERLDATVVDEVVRSVRNACGVPVGVTTGAWIEPNLQRRLELVQAWQAPDYASVNLSEPGSLAMIELLLAMGIGIEAGVCTIEDAQQFGASGLGNQVTRILVEPGELQVGESTSAALKLVEEIHTTLDHYRLTIPRLQHGDGKVTWVILIDSVARGIDTRIGLEDTFYQPNGERTSGNTALVRAAIDLGCW